MGAELRGRAVRGWMAIGSARHFEGPRNPDMVPGLFGCCHLCFSCALLGLRCAKARALGCGRQTCRIQYSVDLSASAPMRRSLWQRGSHRPLELWMAGRDSGCGVHGGNSRTVCHPDALKGSHATVTLHIRSLGTWHSIAENLLAQWSLQLR